MKAIKFITALLFLVSNLLTHSSIIFIPSDYSSIQQGIDAAETGDTIIIDPGEYFEHLILNEKNLIIGSRFLMTNDSNFISQTIINGNGTGRGISISNTDIPTRITGLTFTNCSSSSGAAIFINQSQIAIDNIRIIGNITYCEPAGYSNGGGISIYNSTVHLEQFLIQSNEAYCITPPINPSGGALYAMNSSIILQNGRISNNQAYLGGGIYLSDCISSIHSVEFNQNFAPYPGGAICSFNSSIEIGGSRFSKNTAPGSVIYSEGINPVLINNSLFDNNSGNVIQAGDTLKIINCTFVDNSETSCIRCYQNCILYVMNSIFWDDNIAEIEFSSLNNTAFVGYNDIQAGMSGIIGNANVTFFGPVYDFSPGLITESGYYLSDSSNCIGAGIDTLNTFPFLAAPNVDFNNNIRPYPIGSMPDLGAYENELANPLTGLEETSNLSSDVNVYPNPAIDIITLTTIKSNKIQSIRIIEPLGKIVMERSFKPNPVQSYTIKTTELGIKGLVLIEVNLEIEKVIKRAIIY